MTLASPGKNFISPSNAAQVAPARAAFLGQLAAYREKALLRQQVYEQDAATRRHREAVDVAIAREGSLRAAIDQATADGLDANTAAPDLDSQRRALAEAGQECERLVPLARAADIAHHRFTSQAAALTNDMAALYAAVPRMLHAALVEELEADAAAFREAEEVFRAQHRATFL